MCFNNWDNSRACLFLSNLVCLLSLQKQKWAFSQNFKIINKTRNPETCISTSLVYFHSLPKWNLAFAQRFKSIINRTSNPETVISTSTSSSCHFYHKLLIYEKSWWQNRFMMRYIHCPIVQTQNHDNINDRYDGNTSDHGNKWWITMARNYIDEKVRDEVFVMPFSLCYSANGCSGSPWKISSLSSYNLISKQIKK